MIERKILKALEIISKKLKGKKIRWVLAGSTNLALQGLKIEPKDIDIQTDKEGAFAIGKLLKEYEVKPVKFRRSGSFESYFGEFEIAGVRVEVVGDFRVKVGNKWVSSSEGLVSPETVEVGGMEVPASSLQDELKIYKRLGREGGFYQS